MKHASKPGSHIGANVNNPYHSSAESYERKLNLPVVRNFRRAEQTRLRRFFNEIVGPEDTVLEIGCGTGYYTRDLVKLAQRVIALDDSEMMLRILRDRLPESDRDKVEYVHSEATRYKPAMKADIVVHCGVLDYVKEWEAFLRHSIEHAKRAVIFTCPTNGPWGQVFHILSRYEGVRIQRFHRKQIETYLREKHPGWSVEMHLVGLNGGWTGGMTWIGAIRRIGA